MSQPPCRHKAMDLLSRRPHFRRELEVKLAKRDYDADEIEATLDRLTEQGLLDDRRTADGFVVHRLERQPLGRWRLLAELRRHGADEDTARAALDANFPDDDLEGARAAAERFQRRSSREVTPERLGRHLQGRGFTHHAIFAVLRETAATATDENDPRQSQS
jgi:regulatory protein